MAPNGIKFKSGFASIVGLPNAGKSTFLNAVLKEKIAITSKKPQTTRKNLKGIYNDNDSQIIFLDTPGIYRGKTKLDEYMSKSVRAALDDMELVIVVVDVNTYEKDDYTKILEVVRENKAKKILLINKCDVYDGLIEKAKNDIENRLANIHFEKVLCISSLRNENIDNVILEIKRILPFGNKYYDSEYMTDEPLKRILSDMVRQQCLYKLDKEVPHSLEVIIESMEVSKSNCLHVFANIICDRESHKKIIIGNRGMMIKNIGISSRIRMEKFMRKQVNLKLNVTVRENWKNEKTLLANYGYDLKNV